MKKFLVALTLSLTPLLVATEVVERTFPSAGLKTLRINNGAGEIDVICADTNTARVTAKKKRFEAGCALSIDKVGETLISEVKGNNCEVDFEVAVPANLALDLNNGSGELEVKGASNKIDFHIGTGDVEIESTSAANISGRTGNGKIEVKFRTAPSQGTLDVKTGNGDTKIWMPAGAKVALAARTGNGQVINELGGDPNAKFKIDVNSGNGSIKLLKNDRASE